jgi:AhpC/TSA family.
MSKKCLNGFALSLVAVFFVLTMAHHFREEHSKKKKEWIAETVLPVENQNSGMASKIIFPDEKELPDEGKAAPDFSATTLEGKTVRLSDFRGKWVIFNFWATWCPPCREEMPDLQKFYEAHRQDPVVVLAANLTSQDFGVEKIKEFMSEHQLSLPVLLDERGELLHLYAPYAIPTTYILDQEGIIKKKIVGPVDAEMLESIMAEWL